MIKILFMWYLDAVIICRTNETWKCCNPEWHYISQKYKSTNDCWEKENLLLALLIVHCRVVGFETISTQTTKTN